MNQIFKKLSRWLRQFVVLFFRRAASVGRRLKQLSLPQKYALLCLVVLLASTVYWALLGASLQRSNADQFSSAYLFEHTTTFNQTTFPGAHTQLLKWPLFLAIRAMGFSGFAFSIFTVGLSLVTVAGVAYIIYRIEKRPAIVGTLWLGLASVLLLVPAQPYAGGLLPVNMAMLTTRNVEYLIYIASLIFLIRASRFRSWNFVLATALLTSLIVSDKLFFTLSFGGAFLALAAYWLAAKKHDLRQLLVRWLALSIVALLIANALVWFINWAHITHIIVQGAGGPYTLAHNPKDLALGIIYSLAAILTNFGANPAFDITTLRQLPGEFIGRLNGVDGLAFLVNGLVLIAGLIMVWQLIKPTFSRHSRAQDLPAKLSILMVWTSLAAIIAFIASRHYYAVDARYLAIVLFTVFISMATHVRHRYSPSLRLAVTIAAVIMIGLLFGIHSSVQTYNKDKAALREINERNAKVAAALKIHPVDALVGDYWRVFPIKFQGGNSPIVIPLENCGQIRRTLNSQNWQLDLKNHSFAYLLTLDEGLTDFRGCSLDEVVSAYGRPNSSVLTAGSLDNPLGVLLFYDRGIRHSAPSVNRGSPTTEISTVIPIPPDKLPYKNCPGAPTIMNIVAHQDDDLLFINPDTVHDLEAGHCMRTIYVTAGDAGLGDLYWLQRERGSQGAYSDMLGSNSVWVQRIVKLAERQFVTVANPRGNSKVALIFIRLPDGNLNGQGFKASEHESLERLEAGKIRQMHSVDGQSMYDSAQLTLALTTLMRVYQPTEIRTQAPQNLSHVYPDHSDHMVVGRYAHKAYLGYENSLVAPIKYYIGYPIRSLAENVSGENLQQKENAFTIYGKYDSGVCQSFEECDNTSTYGSYLRRQYQSSP